MADRRAHAFGTVRARVTAVATIVVLVVLTVAGFVIVRVHHDLLVHTLDESMDVAAAELTRAAEEGDTLPTVAGFGDDDAAFQVVGADGVVIAATANVDGAEPIAPPLDDGDVRRQTIDGLPGDPADYRVLSTGVGSLTVHVAATLDDVDESTTTLATTLIVAVPTVTAVLAVAIWFLVGRTLRPVEAIRSEVAEIGGSDLHRRVPEPGGDDEVARLARTMNDMLARVEGASVRQRRFVSDASHELRSPLTRMRTELEVDAAHPGTADVEATQRSVLEEVIGMQRTVEDLLHLARSDAGQSMATEPVALDELVRSEGAGVDLDAVEPVVVTGNADALRRLVRNLLDNAHRHARSSVRVELQLDGGTVELAVVDDGPGIPAAEQERVFERFTRLDDARSASDGGTGLGLAIVREVAEAHGGRAYVDPAATQGTRVVVVLPTSPGS